MPINTPQAPVAYWILQRAGLRARSLVAVHGEDPKVAPFLATVPPLVDAFLDVRNDVRRREGETQRFNAEARAEARVLYLTMQSWIPNLGVDLPHVDMTQFAERSDVVDDVVAHVRRLLYVVRTDQQMEARELSYAPVMLAELEPAVERAEEAARVARQAMRELQERRETQRERALELHGKVVELRRVLRAHLGPRHRDYQMLRLQRLRRDELDGGDPATGLDTLTSSTTEDVA